MPVFFEFLLIALLIFLWESVLWLPRQGMALRRGILGKTWRAIPATRFLALRRLGAVPMMPLPADTWLFPCSGFPLAVDAEGGIHIESPNGIFLKTGAGSWDDIRFSAPNIFAGNLSARCQSPRTVETLREGKELGLSLGDAIRRVWELSLSPPRAKREMKRWGIAVSPLTLYCPVLCIGFFAGLPAAYLTLGPMSAIWLGAWLWCLMVGISIQLFAISRESIPSAKSELRQDALLSLVVPFHAMRAAELASIHAFAATHPAAILLATGAHDHPWLAKFVRSLRFPRPSNPGDAAITETALKPLENILRIRGLTTDRYLSPPDCPDDPDAAAWCPRCHGMFLADVRICRDCGGLGLVEFRQTSPFTSGP